MESTVFELSTTDTTASGRGNCLILVYLLEHDRFYQKIDSERIG